MSLAAGSAVATYLLTKLLIVVAKYETGKPTFWSGIKRNVNRDFWRSLKHGITFDT